VDLRSREGVESLKSPGAHIRPDIENHQSVIACTAKKVTDGGRLFRHGFRTPTLTLSLPKKGLESRKTPCTEV
jgi:hypothetical protein